MVPIEPLTNPSSTYKFYVSITLAPRAKYILNSSPPESFGKTIFCIKASILSTNQHNELLQLKISLNYE